MIYRIAVASSDGEEVDLSFGEAAAFRIYRVDGTSIELEEMRMCAPEEEVSCTGEAASFVGCGSGAGNGTGCAAAASGKAERLSDCRCLVCRKAGFRIIKQLEKRAVSVFDIQCSVEEALRKIAEYYDRLDTHRPLRKIRGREEET
ncbi:MAG: hypothetical protein LUF34_05375 [Lachnospiraceae bacterium]|nr:hypothetical protein [Lachnospiraceae bacterium]